MWDNKTTIPYDVYESETEIVVILPLWWVHKDSLDVKLEKNTLLISWQRKRPELKDDLVAQKQECYWGPFNAEIHLPLTVYFDKIKPILTAENILIITVPKYKLPEDVKLNVELLN